MPVDNKRPNPPQDPRKPEDKKPKRRILPTLVLVLALVLIGSWIFKAISNSQY